MDLEIAIINLISQIPMSIWLYNDGQIVVASTYKINYRKDGRTGDEGESLREKEQVSVQQPRESDDQNQLQK